MKKRTWSNSQRRNYNATIYDRKFKNGVINACISFVFFCIGLIWWIPKYAWKGIKWLYNKIGQKEDNAGL